MSFNPAVIPPEHNTAKQRAIHIEMYRKTQDTLLVYNPTSEDFKVYNDRRMSNESWTVPAKGKDVGFGKGKLNVPRFVAMRYINKMGEKLIIKKSEEEWAKKKLQFRQDEWGEKEERMALRANDKKEWARITPILFLGVVKRYQGDNFEENMEDQKPRKQTFSRAEEAMESLDIADMEVGVSEDDMEDRKNDLAGQLV